MAVSSTDWEPASYISELPLWGWGRASSPTVILGQNQGLYGLMQQTPSWGRSCSSASKIRELILKGLASFSIIMDLLTKNLKTNSSFQPVPSVEVERRRLLGDNLDTLGMPGANNDNSKKSQ